MHSDAFSKGYFTESFLTIFEAKIAFRVNSVKTRKVEVGDRGNDKESKGFGEVFQRRNLCHAYAESLRKPMVFIVK